MSRYVKAIMLSVNVLQRGQLSIHCIKRMKLLWHMTVINSLGNLCDYISHSLESPGLSLWLVYSNYGCSRCIAVHSRAVMRLIYLNTLRLKPVYLTTKGWIENLYCCYNTLIINTKLCMNVYYSFMLKLLHKYLWNLVYR